jgi:predicted Zn-dependent protease
MVALDRDLYAQLDEADDRTEMRAILDHELGHVVGLAHVHDPGELMYDDNVGRSTFGPGDLQGLARVGDVPCD